MKRRTIMLLFCMLAACSWTGCGKDAKETSGDGVEAADGTAEEVEQIDLKKIAVFFSGAESEETAERQEIFKSGLEENEYEVTFLLADEDSNVQKEQLTAQLEQEIDVMVIEPVDPYDLTEILVQAEEKEIPVIAYDDLIMDSSAVSYYTTYSYRNMGQMIGEAIKEEKKLDDALKNQLSYNIEFLMGSQDSLEALFFYNGVMEVLKSYFDAGVLVCPSGKNSFDANGILRWDGEQAGIRFEEILNTYYQDGVSLDIVCTGFDAAAVKAVSILEENGLVVDSENWPLITGLGCEADAVEAVKQEKMFCSIYMDEKVLAETCVKMTEACAKGETPEVNDSVQYDNGVKIVEANVCEAKLYTEKNVEKLEDASANELSEAATGESENTDSVNTTGNEDATDGSNDEMPDGADVLDSMSVEEL